MTIIQTETRYRCDYCHVEKEGSHVSGWKHLSSMINSPVLLTVGATGTGTHACDECLSRINSVRPAVYVQEKLLKDLLRAVEVLTSNDSFCLSDQGYEVREVARSKPTEETIFNSWDHPDVKQFNRALELLTLAIRDAHKLGMLSEAYVANIDEWFRLLGE